jgi:hypothetical protein
LGGRWRSVAGLELADAALEFFDAGNEVFIGHG